MNAAYDDARAFSVAGSRMCSARSDYTELSGPIAALGAARVLDSLPPRLAAKICPEPNSGCWLWLGALTHNGYAHSNRGRVHRVVYELLRGPIPERHELDHGCRVRCCVNPWHTSPMSTRENTLKNTGPTAANARKTACSGCGGPYSLEASTGRRICRPCRKAGRARRKAAQAGLQGAS